MANVVAKARSGGSGAVLVTERGTSFGYGRLVVDMTGFKHLAETGAPLVFDATHSVQEPGALGTRTGGDRTLAPVLARAAVATGLVDGLFFEVHPDPDRAPSDGPNMVRLDDFGAILDGVLAIHAAALNGAAP
jgi:2-dehydro-3-deoxyphosphooctonate aldolase (KDO 8-P synthase)